MSWRQMLHATLALTLALASIAHFGGAIAATDKNSQPIPCEAIDSVGRAKMSPDGTITLQLRSLWPDPIAETQLVFAPDDPQYAKPIEDRIVWRELLELELQEIDERIAKIAGRR